MVLVLVFQDSEIEKNHNQVFATHYISNGSPGSIEFSNKLILTFIESKSFRYSLKMLCFCFNFTTRWISSSLVVNLQFFSLIHALKCNCFCAMFIINLVSNKLNTICVYITTGRWNQHFFQYVKLKNFKRLFVIIKY